MCIMTIVWQVDDNGAWRDYSESFSREAEQRRSDWLQRKPGAWQIFVYEDGGEEYAINFKSMIRMHFPSGVIRKVRRYSKSSEPKFANKDRTVDSLIAPFVLLASVC